MTKDPVCGMEGKPDVKIAHGGKTYYFCAASCLESFKKNPAKFAR